MKQADAREGAQELAALCNAARECMGKGAYRECGERIAVAMGEYPHAPQPHNLMGVLLEKMGDRRAAMKHFRAACALDPGYLPARHNVERFASFYSAGACALDESDCPQKYADGMAITDHVEQDVGRAIVFSGGRVNIAEVPIAQTMPIAGRKIWEIDLPPEAIIGCILRGDKSIVPSGDTEVLAGDVLVLISAGKQEMPAIRILTGRP